MEREIGVCDHLEGLTCVSGQFECPVCGAEVSLDEVYGWVREAERRRDECYIEVEGEAIVRWYQQEVYRRRSVLYELRGISRSSREKPEMVLVIYDPEAGSYNCKIFYKGVRGAEGSERLVIGSIEEEAGGSGVRGDFVTRLAYGKAEEFHALRKELVRRGGPAPLRRVFYSHEL